MEEWRGEARTSDRETDGWTRGDILEEATRPLERAVSPAIGTLLVVAVTLLVASTITASLMMVDDDLQSHREEFDQIDGAINDDTPWIGSPSSVVQQSDNTAGATDVRYRINFVFDPNTEGDSAQLRTVVLEVTTDSPDMFSNTGEAQLEYAFIDENGDNQPEKYVTSDVTDWNSNDDGTQMEIEFDGSYTLEDGDSVIVVFGGVDNPTEPGVYELRSKTNGAVAWETGSVTII